MEKYLIIEIQDTGMRYFIPGDRCNIDYFEVAANVLVLSNGGRIIFKTHSYAEDAYWFVYESMRDQFTYLWLQESSSSYLMGDAQSFFCKADIENFRLSYTG